MRFSDGLRGGENQVIITKGRSKITLDDGQVKEYDVYCEVYRKDDPDTVIHKIGFVL